MSYPNLPHLTYDSSFRDKTKFGGQNRLRQKCLHRRCLLDTHRRAGGGAGAGEQGIYSGLELARLQQTSAPPDHSIFSLLGGSAFTPVS